MSRRRREIRDGHAWCATHQKWEELDAFDLKQNGTVPLYRDCQVARQELRDKRKADDPAYEAIRSRARDLAGKMTKALGRPISVDFVWFDLNYRSLVGPMRALIAPDGICQGCGRDHEEHRAYGNPADPRYWHISHADPPQGYDDFPRMHAENIKLRCPGDNLSQGKTGQREWLPKNWQRWETVRGLATEEAVVADQHLQMGLFSDA